MVFRPTLDRSRWEGLIVCVWIVLIDLLLLLWLARRPVDWIKFGLAFLVIFSLPLLIFWAYRTWAAFTLEYWVDRNSVTLRWANVQQVIPLTAITQIWRQGTADVGALHSRLWPAPYLRPSMILGTTAVCSAASSPLERCLILDTDAYRFALSPAHADDFVDAVLTRRQMGPAQILRLEMRRTAYRERLLGTHWSGPLLIGAGLLGVLVLVGVLMVNFPSLPDVLGFQYNSDGIPIMVRSKNALFLLPVIGFLAWIVNSVVGIWMASRDEPTGAYMLWGGTLIVQACSLLAMLSIIP